MDKRRFNSRTLKIRELNDALRSEFPISTLGRIVLTSALHNLIVENDEDSFNSLVEKIRNFSDFSEDNDPYGEHEFAFFEAYGTTLFFKVEYYDKNCVYGSPDASNESVTTRVLTVGLSDDY